MFICSECKTIYEDYCECCKDYVEEAFQCAHCGEYYQDEDIYRDMCHDCADEAFTVELGFEFLTGSNEEEGFYYDICRVTYGNEFSYFKTLSDIKKEFLKDITSEGSSSIKNSLIASLKQTCVYSDFSGWIDFLYERDKPQGKTMYMKVGA